MIGSAGMKIAAYFALGSGLIAAVAAFVIKIKAIRKQGKATKQDMTLLVLMPLFAIFAIVNLVLVYLYF